MNGQTGRPPEDPVELVDPAEAAGPAEDRPAGLRGMAVCLSGGGYRAMLFHVGALWRLNEAGYLSRMDRISSVSGGTITAAALGLHWGELAFQNGVASRFREALVDPIRGLAGETIDAESVIGGLLTPGPISGRIANAYRKHLFGHKTLQDLPDSPRFVLNATNIQSGVLVRFSKPYLWDYRVGKIANPRIELAVAVGASSAFPPVLSPVILELKDSDFVPGSGKDLQRPPFTTRMVLSDGGVYDNMGIETAWKGHETILVSDAGGRLSAEENPHGDWARHSARVLSVIDGQVRSLRKRQVVSAFEAGTRKGTYWGIRTDVRDYKLPAGSFLDCPFDKTTELAKTPTRLAEMPGRLQERLINWGYAVCDAALRRHVQPDLPVPSGFPYAGGVS
jgi:NTE family protein